MIGDCTKYFIFLTNNFNTYCNTHSEDIAVFELYSKRQTDNNFLNENSLKMEF